MTGRAANEHKYTHVQILVKRCRGVRLAIRDGSFRKLKGGECAIGDEWAIRTVLRLANGWVSPFFFDIQQVSNDVMSYQLVAPSGTILSTVTNYATFVDDTGPIALTETGLYTVRVGGAQGDTPSYQFELVDATPVPIEPIAFDTPVPGAIDRPGRTLGYSFIGTTGQPIVFDVIYNESDGIGFTLRDPSGSAVLTNVTSDQSVTLSASGTYTIAVDQQNPFDMDFVGGYSFQIVSGTTAPPAPAGANLVVSNVTVASQVIGNPAQVDVTWTVTNIAGVPTSSSAWIDRIRFSAYNSFGGIDDRLMADITQTGTLAAGASVVRTETITLPAGFEGEFTVGVAADATNRVYENQDEFNNFLLAAGPTSVFSADRSLTGGSEVRLNTSNGAQFPAGSTVTLSGQASAVAGAVNVLFVVDVSYSTASITGLDANFDGSLNASDDVNGDGRVGDILDAEIGAILITSGRMADRADDLRAAVVAFAGSAEPLDLGSAIFNQVFRDPELDTNGDGVADFKQAARSLFVDDSQIFVIHSGATMFRSFEVAQGTNFQDAIVTVDELIDRGIAADQTHIFFLTDGMPTNGVPTDQELAQLGSRGVRFHGIQITGSQVSADLNRLATEIAAQPESTGDARLVADPNDLATALLASLDIAGVTVNGYGVQTMDAAGNFFTPVTLALGDNPFLVEAIDSAGGGTSESITLVGTDGLLDFHQTRDITALGQLDYSRTTFNRQTGRLLADVRLTNLGADPLSAPVLAVFSQFTPPSVELASADGIDPTGHAYVNFDVELGRAGLAPAATSAPIALEFDNPGLDRFALDVSLSALGNSPPAFTTAPPVDALVGVAYEYQANALDADGDTLGYALAEAPDGVAFNPATGLQTWTPAVADAGLRTFRIQVSDGRGGSSEQAFVLEVRTSIPNRPPVFRSAPITQIDSGEDYTYLPDVVDFDGDSPTFTLPQAPLGMTINPATGQIDFPSPADDDYTVTVRADDGQGGSAEQTYVLTVGNSAANPGAPVILSQPPTEAAVDVLYLYVPLVQDTDGDSLTYSLTLSPTGMHINPATGRIDWVPAANQTGPHTVLLQVDDSHGGVAIQFYTIDVSAELANLPPVIVSSPSFVATQDQPYAYTVAAYDPDGDSVTFELLTGPASMDLDPATGELTWTPLIADLGTHRVKIRATDQSGVTAEQAFDLEVRGPNAPPWFLSTDPPTQISAGELYRYNADASDTEDQISFSLVVGPALMSVDPRTGVVLWNTTVADLGPHDVTLRVTDERGDFIDQTYVLTVVPDVEPPAVSVLLDSAVVDPGTPVTITVLVSDNVGIGSIELQIAGVPVTLNANNQFVYTPSSPGRINITGMATDTSGNMATVIEVLRVIDPADVDPPLIQITSPESEDVITYLTDIVGTVSDPNFDLYRVEYSPSGADEFTLIAEGTTPIIAGVLATFDPTLLPNGHYDLRVFAQDVSGNGTYQQIPIGVEGQAKLGNFRLEFTDLRIPVTGVPITIGRMYDTLDSAQSGDFGFGWSLHIAEARIRETVPITEAELSGAPSLFAANSFRQGTRVYLTNPAGRRVGFTFDPVPEPGFFETIWRPRFIPDPGVHDDLEVDDIPLSQQPDGTFKLYFIHFPFNPTEYRLTDHHGVTYRYDQFTGLQDITDRNNNVLTYTPTGIFDSSGDSIQWLRDPQGRITEIIDPAGNSILYAYDDRGDLISVTDQVGNVTSMTYLREPAHYLETIIDPLGNEVAAVQYDASGRMTSQTDALGDSVGQSYDLVYNTEIVTDQLGNATTYVFDDRGNVTSITNPLGATTSYVFDGDNNILATTVAGGDIVSYTYDTDGNTLSVTDPLGQTTQFEYDAEDRLIAEIDPLDNSRTYTYDALGNLIQAMDRIGRTREFNYDNMNAHRGEMVGRCCGSAGIQFRLRCPRKLEHCL
jgi:YD repeat-containing protein